MAKKKLEKLPPELALTIQVANLMQQAMAQGATFGQACRALVEATDWVAKDLLLENRRAVIPAEPRA